MAINKAVFAAMMGSILAVNILYHIINPAEYMVLGALNAAMVAITACFAGTRSAAMMAMGLALTVNFWIMEPVLQFSPPTIPEYLMLAANTLLAICVPYFKTFSDDATISAPVTIGRIRDCASPIKNSHRKIAIQLCAQLPDGITDARLVMLAMQDIVDNHLDDDRENASNAPPSNVLPFTQ